MKPLKDFLRGSGVGVAGEVDEDDGITTGVNNQYESAVQAVTSNNLELHKFAIETYGCQMNESDSEIVTAILQGAGLERTQDSKDADIVLLNTCAIRDNAERKVWGKLHKIRQQDEEMKKTRSSSSGGRRSKRIVGVLGCMAERLKEQLLEDEKLVQLVAGPGAYRDLPRLLAIVNGSSGGAEHEQAINVQLSQDETYADVAPVRADPSR